MHCAIQNGLQAKEWQCQDVVWKSIPCRCCCIWEGLLPCHGSPGLLSQLPRCWNLGEHYHCGNLATHQMLPAVEASLSLSCTACSAGSSKAASPVCPLSIHLASHSSQYLMAKQPHFVPLPAALVTSLELVAGALTVQVLPEPLHLVAGTLSVQVLPEPIQLVQRSTRQLLNKGQPSPASLHSQAPSCSTVLDGLPCGAGSLTTQVLPQVVKSFLLSCPSPLSRSAPASAPGSKACTSGW